MARSLTYSWPYFIVLLASYKDGVDSVGYHFLRAGGRLGIFRPLAGAGIKMQKISKGYHFLFAFSA